MEWSELIQKLNMKKHTVCLVGAGGKTTTMFRLADELAKCGREVLVATTTHILKPDVPYASDVTGTEMLWESGSYAVVGTPAAEGKLTFPPEELYNTLAGEADLILLEADGAKRHPVKVPAAHEPVIPEDCDLVLALMGMRALHQPLREVCFRYEEAAQWLLRENAENDRLTVSVAAQILSSPQGARKSVGDREFIAVLNQCDNEEILADAKKIAAILEGLGIDSICIRLKT